MGCSINKENIESEMLILQLKKAKIQEERKKMLQMYKDLTGEKLYRKKVPDYIKHEELNENTIKKKDLSNNIEIYKEGTLSTKSNYLNLNTQP